MGKTKLALFVGVLFGFATGSAAEMCADVFVTTSVKNEIRQDIELCAGFATIINTAEPFETVVLGDDTVMTVTVISPQVISITGRDIGRTNLHLFASGGRLISNTNVSVVTYQRPVSTIALSPIEGKTNLQFDTPMSSSGPTPTKDVSRIVVNAGSAEILYDCAENCTKLDR